MTRRPNPHHPACQTAELLEVLDLLPLPVREKRRRDGLSVRAAARDLRVSFSTLSRVEHGEDCSLSNARTLLAWVGEAS